MLPSLPVTATNKVHRVALRREGFRCEDPVWWLPDGEGVHRLLTAEDAADLERRYAEQGRGDLLGR